MGVDRTVLFALATNALFERLVKRVPGGESAVEAGIALRRRPVAERRARP